MLQSSPAERKLASNMECMPSMDNDFLGIFVPLIVVDQNMKRSGFQYIGTEFRLIFILK